MKTKLLIYILLAALFLTSCSGGAAGPTATAVDVNALKTTTVQTVIAPLTQTAAAYTPPPAATATATEAPTEPPTPDQSATPENTPTETPCDNLLFVNDASIPDGTTMKAGEQFVKTWKVRNVGACTWTTGYTIVFAYGDPQLNGPITALTSEVAPKTDTEVSVTLTAPTKSGTYISYWRLKNNNGYFFGTQLTVNIVVP